MTTSSTENPPVGDGNPNPGASTEETGTPPVEPGVNAGDPPGEPKTYDETYVQNLRDEAASHRVKAKRAADAETRLHELSIAQAVSGILVSPDDLNWSDEYTDEHGWPDEAKIIAAAEELVARKPHLARVRGDVGQGQRGDAVPPVSLSGLLRAGA
jgi:hypothetical protein